MKRYDSSGLELSGSMVARGEEAFRHAGGSGLEVWYLAGASNGLALATATMTANVLRAFPFVAPARGGTLDRLGFNVTTLLAGNSRIGLYASVSESNLYPSALLEDSGSISTATTGVKSYTINRALKPGRLYYLAHVCDVAVVLRGFAVGGVSSVLGISNALGTTPNLGVSVAHTYGALPATFTAGGAMITAVPLPALGYRFSG